MSDRAQAAIDPWPTLIPVVFAALAVGAAWNGDWEFAAASVVAFVGWLGLLFAIQRSTRGNVAVTVALGFICGVWWTVGFLLDVPRFSVHWIGIYGTLLMFAFVAIIVGLDWYRNPTTAVDDWDDAESGGDA